MRHIVGVQVDVTQEKLTEAELRESRERLLMSLRAACMGTYEYLHADRRINLSPLSADVFGLWPGQSVDGVEAFYALMHPDDRMPHRHVLERAAMDGGDFHIDYRIVRPRDQRVAWIEEHGHGDRARDGESRVRGVHWDISERKHAEQALNESRERLRVLIDGIPQLVWRSDPGGMWTWASRPVGFVHAMCRRKRAVGEGWLDAVHPDDRDRARLAWQRADAAGNSASTFA